jgi:hypothetical protein
MGRRNFYFSFYKRLSFLDWTSRFGTCAEHSLGVSFPFHVVYWCCVCMSVFCVWHDDPSFSFRVSVHWQTNPHFSGVSSSCCTDLSLLPVKLEVFCERRWAPAHSYHLFITGYDSHQLTPIGAHIVVPTWPVYIWHGPSISLWRCDYSVRRTETLVREGSCTRSLHQSDQCVTSSDPISQ